MGIRYLDEKPKSRIRYLDEETPKPTSFLDAVKGASPLFQGINLARTALSKNPEEQKRLIEQGKGQLSAAKSEILSPLMSGASTFAAGVPKMAAKAVPGAAGEVFPEQQTVPGKLLRAGSEIGGFAAGLPGKAALFTGKAVAKGIHSIPKFVGQQLAKRVVSGATAGAVGGGLAGDTIESRKQGAAGGAAIGGAIPAISPIATKAFRAGATGGRIMTGIEKDTLEEVQQKGFRNVIKNKYFNKKMPQEIQMRIEQNLDKLETEAGNTYDELTAPLKKHSFDLPQFRVDVVKIANRVKLNPFETDVSKLDNAILDGVINKAKVNNLGDALDLRRNLDDVIYSNKGELKSSFGKQVRDLLNKELHKNKDLAGVDKNWSSLKEALKEGKKATGETGEKFLARFSTLTEKQKEMLVKLEKKIGGEPFIEDLTNYGLAKEFVTRKVSLSPTGIIRATAKPMFRGYLRQGEKLTGGLNKLDKKFVGKLLGE